jgi:DNA repair photolyase
VFGTIPGVATLRWKLADEEGESGQGSLFDADELLGRHFGSGEFAGIEFLHVNARRVINRVPASSRMPFQYTINAYRGCTHACVYCFARPTHDYLGLGIGEDFERKIVVKVNAVERVRAELASPKWSGDPIAMGTNTDPYQRCEGKYHLTQGIIEALAAAANPFSILTKSSLVVRDVDLLVAASRRASVRVSFSIGTLDEEVWRSTEPGTPHPRQRLNALRRLAAAGLECGVLVAPIIPGLSDDPDRIRQVVEACWAAGARSVSTVGLHLRPGVKEHYLGWLQVNRPDLVPAYRRLYGGGSYLPSSAQARLAGLTERARPPE